MRTGHRRFNNGNQDLRECSGFPYDETTEIVMQHIAAKRLVVF
ncbi:hypothetical protein ACOJBO_09390 [Rhizobium beringeri]